VTRFHNVEEVLTDRLHPFTSTVFAEMTALAVATNSVNLGQGFPDTDGPALIAQEAQDAIARGENQYPPGIGIPALREAVAKHQRDYYNITLDPQSELLITAGATEAIAAAMLALCSPTDEVVVFEPIYDSYPATIAMAGARIVAVPLSGADWSYDKEVLERAITKKTKVLLLNTPNNPTGKVFSREELAHIASLCVRHDLIAVTDEVYEHLIFEGTHIPLATFEGMAERTLTISSAGKTFSFTGWKIGWVSGPAPLVAAVKAVKQFLTYAGGTPFQAAIAKGLNAGPSLIEPLVNQLKDRREQLCRGFEEMGWEVRRPAGTYFAITDISSIYDGDSLSFCRSLPQTCGVVAVPASAFYLNPKSGAHLVRWAFCKREEVISEALARLEKNF
jgi:N-succinyldiaminopimelate aminotransferase